MAAPASEYGSSNSMSELILRLDNLRLRVHFARVTLWLKLNAPHQNGEKDVAREKQIAELRRYAAQGIFPRNHTHKTMRPCFIDRDDRRCTVAHLLIQSGYEDTAQMIAAQANDAYVPEMPFPELDVWAGQYGLTREELAVIQPAYPPSQADMQGIATAVAMLGTQGILIALLLSVSCLTGLVGGVLTILDWRRRRWRNLFPVLTLVCAITYFLVAFQLAKLLLDLVIAATYFADVNRVLQLPEAALLNFMWVLSGLSFPLAPILAGVGIIGLLKNLFLDYRERRKMRVEVVTA